jgi:hypothetical protein
MNVVSAHVVMDKQASERAVVDHLCCCLSSQFDIEHSTFQLESESASRNGNKDLALTSRQKRADCLPHDFSSPWHRLPVHRRRSSLQARGH